MTVGIYGIFDSETDECLYVGMSKSIEERWRHHLKELRSKKHKRKDFVKWFHDNGAQQELLSFRVLEECEHDEKILNLAEIKWFNALLPKYYGKKPSENERWTISEETRQKISAFNYERYGNIDLILEKQMGLLNKLAKDPDVTRQEAAEILGVSSRKLKAFTENNKIKWIFVRQLAIHIEKHQELLDTYFNERITTRELAQRYETTQKSIMRVFDLYRDTDPRFKSVNGRKGLDDSRRLESAKQRRGTTIIHSKQKCQYCQKLIGSNTIKKHEASCKNWNECLVCGVRPKKKTSKYCFDHRNAGRKNKKF